MADIKGLLLLLLVLKGYVRSHGCPKAILIYTPFKAYNGKTNQ